MSKGTSGIVGSLAGPEHSTAGDLGASAAMTALNVVLGAGLGALAYKWTKRWTFLLGAAATIYARYKKEPQYKRLEHMGYGAMGVSLGVELCSKLGNLKGLEANDGSLMGGFQEHATAVKDAFMSVLLPFNEDKKLPAAASPKVEGIGQVGDVQYLDYSKSVGELTEADLQKLNRIENNVVKSGMNYQNSISGGEEQIFGPDDFMSGPEDLMSGPDEFSGPDDPIGNTDFMSGHEDSTY